MTPKLLVAAFAAEDRPYVDRAIEHGIDVRILDCFEDVHALVQFWYKRRSIHVPAQKQSVKSAVGKEYFDMAVIRDTPHDFVRAALLAQTLREANVGQVVVVANDASRVPIYRRCGAHQVVISEHPVEFWTQLEQRLLSQVTAS
ncbi:hypothetical protein AAC03nite_19310 [Alicyclobacillus acidoterrestris]|uniref:hypothetical protein n=1 Tax=Alicyclobacillus suci TaxID=2816080 RepID=UPI0011902A9E|nr:hypothetical protein [Alicyclobacillus suci]GEO26146.1 hypothetical protein AAC03nite_19310 [Alicyclobacillus acidoterrestris]